jgi:mRNA interferase ChpB
LERGQIWIVPLDPTQGHEQQGTRPVVILTMASFNKQFRLPIIAPITRGADFARVRGFTVSLTGLGLKIDGVVRCDQPRVLDLQARTARYTGERVPDHVMDDILARVASLFE